MVVNRVRRNGSYAPLSAHYYKDEGLIEAGERAELLYLRGLAFCADVISDGFISDGQLTRVVGTGLTGVKVRASRLVAVGAWVRDDDRGGYIIRSWEKWNRTKAEIEDGMRSDSERKRGGT